MVFVLLIGNYESLPDLLKFSLDSKFWKLGCSLLQSVCVPSRRNSRTTNDHVRDEQSRVPRLLDYLTSETKEGCRHTVGSNPIVTRPLEINQFRGRCVNSVRCEGLGTVCGTRKITNYHRNCHRNINRCVCSNLRFAWILRWMITHNTSKQDPLKTMNENAFKW